MQLPPRCHRRVGSPSLAWKGAMLRDRARESTNRPDRLQAIEHHLQCIDQAASRQPEQEWERLCAELGALGQQPAV